MFDLTLVIPPQNRGWILDKMAKVIGKAAEKKGMLVHYAYRYDLIPPSKYAYCMHFSIVKCVAALNKQIEKIGFHYTHKSSTFDASVDSMKKCNAIVVSNERGYFDLVEAGIDETIIHTIPECADIDKFRPHERTGTGAILISAAYYPRKNPDLIMAIAKAMPERQFKILGKNWEHYPKYPELVSLDNMTILQNVPYEDYPEIYSSCDVFLSCSTLEGGGPVPLVEAMSANLVPVASNTGNSSYYIINRYSGYIFEVDWSVERMVEMINLAFLNKIDVSKTVEHLKWETYGKEVIESLFPSQTLLETSGPIY